jgi:hypothetical protein
MATDSKVIVSSRVNMACLLVGSSKTDGLVGTRKQAGTAAAVVHMHPVLDRCVRTLKLARRKSG